MPCDNVIIIGTKAYEDEKQWGKVRKYEIAESSFNMLKQIYLYNRLIRTPKKDNSANRSQNTNCVFDHASYRKPSHRQR